MATPRARMTAAVFSVLVALAACGGDTKGAQTGTSVTPGVASATPTASAAASTPGASPASGAARTAAASPVNVPDGPCYVRELWDECTLIKRLESQGYVPKVDGRNAGKLAKVFTAPLVELLLGRGRLRAFIYATEAEANADLARADTVGQAACPAPPNAKYGATLLHSGNLVALLEAGNENTCIRVGDLIRAGLPKYEPLR